MNIYFYLGLLVILLAFLIGIAWYLSFQVPEDVLNPIEWIWENYKSWLIIYLCLMVGIVGVSLLMFSTPSLVKSEAPLSQSGIFLYSSAVLLLSNFFVTPTARKNGTYDNHPLLFYSVVFFLSMAFLTGAIDSGKIYYLNRT